MMTPRARIERAARVSRAVLAFAFLSTLAVAAPATRPAEPGSRRARPGNQPALTEERHVQRTA